MPASNSRSCSTTASEWAGVIEGAIRGDAMLAGAYTLEQATEITQMLRSGTLPVSLDVGEVSSVGPSLGQAIQEMGCWRCRFRWRC